MSLKVFSILIAFGTIISWLGLGMIILYFDPTQTSFLGFSLFYLSLFLGFSGTIFLLADFLKGKIFKKQLVFIRVRNSVRHAILFTILFTSWAFLKSHDLLRIWNLLLLILILAILEFFFISAQKKYNYERETPTI